MAIDPRISLSPAPTINVGQRYAQTLQNMQQQDLLNARREQAPLLQEQLQMQTDLLSAQQPAKLQNAEFSASGQSQLANEQAQMQEIATGYATTIKPLLGNPEGLIQELQRQKTLFQAKGIDVSGINDDIRQAQTPEGMAELQKEVDTTLNLSGNLSQKSVSQREFENNVSLVKNDPEMKTVEAKAAAVALGLEARASSSSKERIARDKDLSKAVASASAEEAGAQEGAKLEKRLKFNPKITRAVKLAEKEAAERGGVLTDLARAEAGLPGLIEATNSLKELATAATSTYGGRLFDLIAKESGWGSTKGANARSKYIAIIDNQVLPLLKQTFGAAMTEGEGLRLSNTLGDANASPEQKMLQTEAFINQKLRDIEALKNQANQPQGDQDIDDPLGIL